MARPLAVVSSDASPCWRFIVVAHREARRHKPPTNAIAPPAVRLRVGSRSVPKGRSTAARLGVDEGEIERSQTAPINELSHTRQPKTSKPGSAPPAFEVVFGQTRVDKRGHLVEESAVTSELQDVESYQLRTTAVVPFIKCVPSSKLTTNRVPEQFEELDPIMGRSG
jgi:hypothetical protein